MRKIYMGLLMLTFSLLLGSCSLKKLINRQFPPLSETDQQYASVERNLKSIDSLDPHIGAFVSKEIMLEYLPGEIKKAIDSLKDENVIVHKVDPVLSFDKQGIFLHADFHIGVPEENAEIKGSLRGVVSPSTSGDSLFLSSAIGSLKITDVTFTKKPRIGRKTLAKILVPVLKNYMQNINGQVLKKPTVVDIAWSDSYQLDLKKLFTSAGTEVDANPITVSRHIKQNSIRVDTTGITILVELADEKPQQEVDTAVLTSKKKISDSDLEKKFKEFDQKFNGRWYSVFDTLQKETGIAAAISKAEIARSFNLALSQPIAVKQGMNIPKETFDKKVEVKRGDVNCQAVRKPFSYPDFNGASCSWSCRWYDLACKASREACKVKRETERIAHNLAREAARIAHQARNEAAVAACNVIREASDFMALGRFKGHVGGDITGRIEIQKITFAEDLSQMAINYSGKVHANLNSRLELQPVDLGHVFLCFANFSKSTTSNVNVTLPQNNLVIGITASRTGQNLNLSASPSSIPYSASMGNSPLHALLADPQFVVQCPIFSTIVGGGTVIAMTAKFLDLIKLAPEQELLLMGKVRGNYQLSDIGTVIKPIKVAIVGEEEKATEIFWNSKSIQFTVFKSPAQITLRN